MTLKEIMGKPKKQNSTDSPVESVPPAAAAAATPAAHPTAQAVKPPKAVSAEHSHSHSHSGSSSSSSSNGSSSEGEKRQPRFRLFGGLVLLISLPILVALAFAVVLWLQGITPNPNPTLP